MLMQIADKTLGNCQLHLQAIQPITSIGLRKSPQLGQVCLFIS